MKIDPKKAAIIDKLAIIVVIVYAICALYVKINGLNANNDYESSLESIIEYKFHTDILYPTITIIIIALIGIFFILKRFIKPIKILKYTLYALIILVPCALIFLRTIPDYSNEYGFNIVSLSNYNKYNQGYCLKENRILSKEERFKRGIVDYWKKGIAVDNMLVDENCKVYGYSSQYCNFGSKDEAMEVGAYETNKFDNKNWYEVIKKRQDETNSTITSLILNDFNITKTQINEDDIVVNLKDNSAGFKKPIIYYLGDSFFIMYHDRSFALGKDFSFCRGCNCIHFEYDKISKEVKEKYNQKFNDSAYYSTDIDNCGNADFPINAVFYNTKQVIGKGG